MRITENVRLTPEGLAGLVRAVVVVAWSVMIVLVALAVFLVGHAWGTAPNPEHKVTICHATPPDTAAQGYVSITVDVASVGYQHSGHQDQHDADIIPPYSYTDAEGHTFSYPGKGDQSILANGCVVPDDPTTTVPETTVPQTTVPVTTVPVTTVPSDPSTTVSKPPTTVAGRVVPPMTVKRPQQPPTAQVASSTLPATGGDHDNLIAAGLVILWMGGVCLLIAKGQQMSAWAISLWAKISNR